MKQDERAGFHQALAAARRSAYPPGEYVGQESFMRASEVLSLARRAGARPGACLLDLCCGVAGPGRLVAETFGVHYLGVDASPGAVHIARSRTQGLDCAFMVATVPPVPRGPFEVVLLLETVLAFPDKDVLVDAVAGALEPGGRFAFTLEAGEPLSSTERRRMPDADTVWPVPLPDMERCLARAGLRLRWHTDWTATHLSVAASLTEAYARHAGAIAAHVGPRAADELVAAHELWVAWMGSGRIRKVAAVAEKPGAGSPPTG